jgi:hypothetical protein
MKNGQASGSLSADLPGGKALRKGVPCESQAPGRADDRARPDAHHQEGRIVAGKHPGWILASVLVGWLVMGGAAGADQPGCMEGGCPSAPYAGIQGCPGGPYSRFHYWTPYVFRLRACVHPTRSYLFAPAGYVSRPRKVTPPPPPQPYFNLFQAPPPPTVTAPAEPGPEELPSPQREKGPVMPGTRMGMPGR